MPDEERWQKLRDQAVDEQNFDKLLALIDEIKTPAKRETST
jgi:hypothetical protein